MSQKGFTPTAIEQLGPLLEQEGYEITYASSISNKVVRLVDMASAILKNRNKVDVVLIDTYSTAAFYFAWVAALICKQIGLPYIPILHGGNLPYRLHHSPQLSKQVFAYSYTNVAVSPYLQKQLQLRGYAETLIPNSLHLADYPFCARINISPNLLWVRSFHKIYNPQMALQVLSKVLIKYPQAMLTMVGPDKDGTLQKCKDLAMQLGISHKVKFTGMLTKQQWVKLADGHDIFINTSAIDNMPFSIIEAMALGMVVVSTNVGGIPYLVNDVNGYLVDSGDIDGMVNCISDILEKHDAAKYSKYARATAEQYDWNTVKKSWVNLLDKIKGEHEA